jgi:L-Ala-D/L-Glu epimerase
MEPIQNRYFPFRLQYKYPFRIAHTMRTGTDNVYLLLESGGHSAWGECVFVPYYQETIHSFEKLIAACKFPLYTEGFDDFVAGLKQRFPSSYFCIAALDIALHNLRVAMTGQSIYDHFQLNGSTEETSFTIGICSNQEMEAKFTDHPSMASYKLKVNQAEIERIVNHFQFLSCAPFTIDANQGFTDRNEALKWSFQLADRGVAYLEQPFHKEDFDSHAWLKARSPLPIIADESFQHYRDLEKVVRHFDGINLKVMKCGGLSEGVACLQRAREMELKSIIGCMSESSIASSASYEIASLADWVDLDGPLLLNNDPFADKRTKEEIIDLLQKGRNE